MPHGYGPLVLRRLDDGANRRRSPHRGTVREVEAARRAASAAAHTRTGPGLRWRSPANRRELTSWSKGDSTIRETGLVRRYLERRYERMEPRTSPSQAGRCRRAQVAAAQITAAHAALAGSAAAQGQSRAEHQGWWTCRSTASPARTSNC